MTKDEQELVKQYLASNQQLLHAIADMVDYTTKLIKFYNEEAPKE